VAPRALGGRKQPKSLSRHESNGGSGDDITSGDQVQDDFVLEDSIPAPVLSDVERMTLLGCVAGYRGFTRDAYALDLRQFIASCWQHGRSPASSRKSSSEARFPGCDNCEYVAK
jgi:hypothetical protein